MCVQVFVPWLYGRSEAESSGPRESLKPLSDLARLLLPRPEDGDDALEKKGDSGALQWQTSMAPWSAAAQSDPDRQRRDIVLVQGPAGSGKSLFVWSLYNRFGQRQTHALCACMSAQTPGARRRTR